MKIAIFGATSQIAKDLIHSFELNTDYHCDLYSRDSMFVLDWLKRVNEGNHYNVLSYDEFTISKKYDVIINFVGIGDPVAAKEMGSKIFDVTYKFDALVLHYLESSPSTKYIFLSSGAVYGGEFSEPVGTHSKASFPINNFKETDWYGVAKLYAEARHRALTHLSIVDVRVFNYFSSTQNLMGRFLITDLVRAIVSQEVFITSADNIVRDYITPEDFFRLIFSVIEYDQINMAVDCYTKSPVDKITLLSELQKKYALKVSIGEKNNCINATGSKINYYSINKIASSFGYSPTVCSLDGLLNEISLIINK